MQVAVKVNEFPQCRVHIRYEMHTFVQARSSCKYNHGFIYYFTSMDRTGAWIFILVVAVSSLTVLSQTCPSEPFSAVFTASIDQTFDTSSVQDDPELVFFKTIMKFSDTAIQRTVDDAIQFFKDRFGLDFSASTPNEKNERFFENAKMSPFFLPPDKFNYIVTINNWFRSGNTRSTCYPIRDGGFRVTFSANQTLRGSYGGSVGKPAGLTDLLVYGFYNIEVCKQSPIIIQAQSGTPVRTEPIDGIRILNMELNNSVLGRGRAQGIVITTTDPDKPGQFRVTLRNTFTFPAL